MTILGRTFRGNKYIVAVFSCVQILELELSVKLFKTLQQIKGLIQSVWMFESSNHSDTWRPLYAIGGNWSTMRGDCPAAGCPLPANCSPRCSSCCLGRTRKGPHEWCTWNIKELQMHVRRMGTFSDCCLCIWPLAQKCCPFILYSKIHPEQCWSWRSLRPFGAFGKNLGCKNQDISLCGI